MSDNLTVFGTDFTNVAGIKATGTGNGTLTYIRPQGTKSITENGTQDVTGYASVNVNVSGGSSPSLQAKTATPSTSQQVVSPDSGYDGLSSVTVEAMPSGTAGTPTASKGSVSNHSVAVTPSVTNTAGYIPGGTLNGTAVTVSASELVSGSETKTANGTYDVTNLESLVVDVPSQEPRLQEKTVYPKNVLQEITADSSVLYDLAEETTVTMNQTSSAVTVLSDLPSSFAAAIPYRISGRIEILHVTTQEVVQTITFDHAVCADGSGLMECSTWSSSTGDDNIRLLRVYNGMLTILFKTSVRRIVKLYDFSISETGVYDVVSRVVTSDESKPYTRTIDMSGVSIGQTIRITGYYASGDGGVHVYIAKDTVIEFDWDGTTKTFPVYYSQEDTTYYYTVTVSPTALTINSTISATLYLVVALSAYTPKGDYDGLSKVTLYPLVYSTYYTSSSSPTSSQGVDGDVWLVTE